MDTKHSAKFLGPCTFPVTHPLEFVVEMHDMINLVDHLGVEFTDNHAAGQGKSRSHPVA